MARTVLPFVGAAIGFWVGGPTGAQVGFALGGVVGNAVDPVKNIGPRIGETGAQTSAEGAPRGIVYGTVQVTGNVIASGPLIKADVESEGGGKGGPVNVTERCYRFYAIRICEGPIAAVLRIWEDDKLVYDKRPGSMMVEASDAWNVGNVFYPGDEVQLPDVFNTLNINEDSPAYRGTAYMTFGFRDLTDRRGSIPQYRFEVATASSVQTIREPLQIFPWTTGGLPEHSVGGGEYSLLGGMVPGFYADFTAAVAAITLEGSTSGDAYVDATGNLCTIPIGFYSETNSTFSAFDGGATVEDSPEFVYEIMAHETPSGFNGDYLPFNEQLAGAGASGPGPSTYVVYDSFNSSFTGIQGIENLYRINLTNVTSGPFFMTAAYWSPGLYQIGAAAMLTMKIERLPAPPPGFTEVAGTAKILCDNEYRDGKLYQQAQGPVLLPGDPDYDNADFWADARTAAIADGRMESDVLFPVVVSHYATGSHTVAGDPVPLSAIVNDIHARCDDDHQDVSELDDMVAGLVLAGDYTGADAINTLRGPYFFDKAEANGTIYYPKRGAAVVDTLTIDDLIDEPDTQMREQALEYPKKFHLFYQHAASGYAVVKATSQRSSPDARVVGEATAQVPVVLNEDQAAQTAHKMHKVSWAEAEGEVRFSVPWSFIERVPSNPIGLYLRNRVSRLRITEMALADGVIDVTARHDRQSAYTSNVTGVPIPEPTPPPATIVGATTLLVLDIPSLRDTDDDLNLYYAVTGAQPAWHGAVIQQSRDGGSTWNTVAVKNQASVVGELVADVADASTDYTDTTNAVTVRLYRTTQTLESISESAFLSEGGAFALENADGSWEILQARDWTEQSNGDFTGTTLHRGRLNTTTNAHTAGQRFVLLDTTLHVPMQSGMIGTTLTHRAPSLDQAPELAETQDLLYVGRSQREWPVASLAATVDGSDIMTATWAARHRFGTDDAPVASVNFTGFRATVGNLAQNFTVDTTAQSWTQDVSSLPAPYALTVTAMNRITGPGEPSYIVFGGGTPADAYSPSGITVTSAARFAHQIGNTIVTGEQNGPAGAARFFDENLTPLGIYGGGAAPMGCASVGDISYFLFDSGGGASRVARFDRTISYSVPTVIRNIGNPITDIVLCGTDVWIAAPSTGEAIRINPVTLADANIVTAGALHLASDGASVYASGSSSVFIIDNATLAVTSLPLPSGTPVWDMVFAAGTLVVSQVNVAALHPVTGAVLATLTTAPGSDATLSATGNILAIDRGIGAPALIVQSTTMHVVAEVQAAGTMLGTFALTEARLLVVDNTPQAEIWTP